MRVGEDRFTGYGQHGEPILSCWLTRMEWKACFVLWWCGLGTGAAYGAEEIPQRERMELWENVRTGLTWSIRLLARKGSYRFTGVWVDEKGAVQRRPEYEHTPVEPKNELFLNAIKVGRMPVDLEVGIPAVVHWMRGNGVTLDTDFLMDCHHEVCEQLRMVREGIDPEDAEMVMKAMVATLESIGIRMVEKGKRIRLEERAEDFFYVN